MKTTKKNWVRFNNLTPDQKKEALVKTRRMGFKDSEVSPLFFYVQNGKLADGVLEI